MKKTLSSLLILGSLLVMAGCSGDEKSEPKEDATKKEEVVKNENENKAVIEDYEVKQEEIFFNNEKLFDYEQGEKPADYGLHITPLKYAITNEVYGKSGKSIQAKDGNVFLITEHKVENKSKYPVSMTSYLISPIQITFDSGYTYKSDYFIETGYKNIKGIESNFIADLNPLDSYTHVVGFEVNESLIEESFTLEIVAQNAWEGDTPINLIKFEKQ